MVVLRLKQEQVNFYNKMYVSFVTREVCQVCYQCFSTPPSKPACLVFATLLSNDVLYVFTFKKNCSIQYVSIKNDLSVSWKQIQKQRENKKAEAKL